MKKTVKSLLIIIGAMLLFIFTAPIIGGIFNIGNIIGIAFAAVLLIIGKYVERLLEIIRKIIKNKTGKIVFSTLCTAAFCCLACFFIALGSVVASSSTNADKQQTVIVLGCAVYDETPSIMLSARVNSAYSYLTENENAVAILSGGQGSGESISEAECMKRLLLEKGIDENRLYLEDKSTNTYENIKNSIQIIQEEGTISENIAIVTSDFHLKRATMLAANQGYKAYRISAKSGFFATPTFYVRDTLGVIKEFIFR